MILVLRGGARRVPNSKILDFPEPLGGHVGTIFRSWALLGRLLRVLLCFLSLLGGSYAFFDPRNSILEGLGTIQGRFWSVKTWIFRGCCTQT